MTRKEQREEIRYRLKQKSYLVPIFDSVLGIPGRLFEYDKNIFVVFNRMTETLQLHSLANRPSTFGCTIPYSELDGRTLDLAHKTDYHKRGQSIFDEIDAANEALKRENKRLRRDEIGDVAERIQKPLREVAYS